MKERVKEENAIVLDFLKNGYSEDSRPFHQREPIVQAIGSKHFILLELVPQKDIQLHQHDEVYIGDGVRKEISYIKGTLKIEKLTQAAKTELPHVIEKIIDKNPDKFIEFFNKCGAISLRAHQLELLPGVGKRHAREIIEERSIEPFISFEDIKTRVKSISDPKKLIIQRIIDELNEKDRYKLFVRA